MHNIMLRGRHTRICCLHLIHVQHSKNSFDAGKNREVIIKDQHFHHLKRRTLHATIAVQYRFNFLISEFHKMLLKFEKIQVLLVFFRAKQFLLYCTFVIRRQRMRVRRPLHIIIHI